MKKILAILLTCSLLVSLFAGCASGSSGRVSTPQGGDSSGSGAEAAQPKTVVIGAQSDLITLDPGNMYEPYANMISYAAYDMLYRVETGTMGTPVPSVATDVEIDDTHTVYTFPLRDDVVFASGNKLTAKDVHRLGIVDRVIAEPLGGAHRDASGAAQLLKQAIVESMDELRGLSASELLERRYNKFRGMGRYLEVAG